MNSRLLLIVPIRLNKSSFFSCPNASIRCRASRFSPDIYSHPPSLYACLREKFKTLANETCWIQRSVQMSRWEESCIDIFVTRRSVATKTSRSRVSSEDTTLAGRRSKGTLWSCTFRLKSKKRHRQEQHQSKDNLTEYPDIAPRARVFISVPKKCKYENPNVNKCLLSNPGGRRRWATRARVATLAELRRLKALLLRIWLPLIGRV